MGLLLGNVPNATITACDLQKLATRVLRFDTTDRHLRSGRLRFLLKQGRRAPCCRLSRK